MDSGKVLLLVKHFGMASTVFVCATVKIPGHTLAGPLVGIAPKFKKARLHLSARGYWSWNRSAPIERRWTRQSNAGKKKVSVDT